MNTCCEIPRWRAQGANRVFDDFLKEVQRNSKHALELTPTGLCEWDALTEAVHSFYEQYQASYEKESKAAKDKQAEEKGEEPPAWIREPELDWPLLKRYGIHQGIKLDGYGQEVSVVNGFQQRCSAGCSYH